MIPARRGIVAVLFLLTACGGATPSAVRTPGGGGPSPVDSPDVTDEPTSSAISGGSYSVDPDFTPGTGSKDQSKKKGKAKKANPPATADPDIETSADKWAGTEYETAYETEFAVCKSFGVKAVAEEYGAPASPIDAALAASESYQPAFQQAAFEGCLDGFNAR